MKAMILVIDDSALARRTLRQMLEPEGYDVIEASDGLSGLERYFVDRPDVVLLDLVMGGMYGLEVLKKIRELDSRARVLVVSADVQSSSQELAEREGAVAFLNKPLRREHLLGALQDACPESQP